MEPTDTTTTNTEAAGAQDPTQDVEELIEDISIDGMCGVY